jgi:hypothetical protein
MGWCYVTGIINLEDSVTKDCLIEKYSDVSYLLSGSEGGLNLNFTETFKKNFSSSSDDEYYVDPVSRIDNMTITGSLRGFDAEKSLDATDGILTLLTVLKRDKHIRVRNASFMIESTDWNYYYTVNFTIDQKIRSRKHIIKNKT